MARTHKDYLVGIICALAVEKAPVVAMLDEIHPKLEKESGDDNDYTLGRIDVNNVVIACLPAGLMGNGPAAIVANNMRRSFPIKFGLMVGVGGGIWSQKNDIRLGDVVVSQPTGTHGGVVQWDYGKSEFRRTGSLNMPPPTLLHALQALKTFQETDGIDLQEALSVMIKNKPHMAKKYKYQGVELDQLFEATYDHKGDDECDGCDTQSIVPRTSREDSTPEIYYGNIASGNQVMKHGATRDRIAKHENVICFEMEAAGLVNDFPCLVIRGICDYADSHKNKRWQPYAAATAAAFARVLLGFIDKQEVIKTPRLADFRGHFSNSMLRPVANYVARPSLQQKIKEQLHVIRGDDEEDTRILVIYGLGGSGKSQLALNFLHTCRREYASMFWIEAGQKETIERDYLSIYRLLFGRLATGLQSPTVQEAVVMVKSWFHGQGGRSLVIFDNADIIDNATDASYIDLGYFLPDAPSVDVIITTRSSQAQDMTALKAVEVADMGPAEAAELFRTSAKLGPTGPEVEEEILLIVKELGYLALEVKLAGSYVAATPRLSSDLGQCLREYRDRRKQLLNVGDSEASRLETQQRPQQTRKSGTPIYQPLDGGQIRLVVLRYGEAEAPVEVQLRILPFDGKTKYDALSYSVGTPEKSAIINLRHHGQREELRVTARLASILKHLRSKDKDRILWVDALSINQADLEERAREVRRLGKIFAAAHNVCIWLGEAADDSDLAMDFIPEILNFGAFDELVRDETRKLHWLALAKLMAREWFTRRWVVQEMALARNAIVFCGDRQIPWADLANAATLFGTMWQEIVLWLPPMEAFMLGDAQTPGATSLVELSSDVFRKDGSTQTLERRLGIETLLNLVPMFDVTVPLDSVYSLIDIAHDTYETDEIKVDYNLEPQELFGNITKLIIEGSRSLDIICRPWAPVCDLPSWITTTAHHAFERRDDGQYFRQNADSLVGSPGRSIYRASGDITAECQFELADKTETRMIKCNGLSLGHVRATGGRSINGSVPREWRRLAGWSDRSRPIPEAFWRTLVADRGPGGISPPTWYGKACEYSFRKSRTDIDVSQLIGISTSSNERKFLQRVQATTWNRVFFTMDGTGKHDDHVCFGLGPAKIAAGDEVVILYGCSVPVILRHRPEFRHGFVYELVGEAFVYGFMDAEAIVELRKGSYHQSKFSIA